MTSQKELRLGNTIELNNDTDLMDSSFSEGFNTNRTNGNNNALQKQILSKKPKEVVGLISQMNEFFLLEKKVPFVSSKVECWLQGTESSM